MPKKTWAGLLVLLPILIWAVQIVVVEAIGTAALDSIVESGLAVFGLEKSHMSAVLAPFVIPGLYLFFPYLRHSSSESMSAHLLSRRRISTRAKPFMRFL